MPLFARKLAELPIESSSSPRIVFRRSLSRAVSRASVNFSHDTKVAKMPATYAVAPEVPDLVSTAKSPPWCQGSLRSTTANTTVSTQCASKFDESAVAKRTLAWCPNCDLRTVIRAYTLWRGVGINLHEQVNLVSECVHHESLEHPTHLPYRWSLAPTHITGS